jgi:hypothetical protein
MRIKLRTENKECAENRRMATITILIIIVEIYLHRQWGFCDVVLMQESDKFEYIAQPNQNHVRFGKHIRYNAYSMRSDNLQLSKRLLNTLVIKANNYLRMSMN